jgi:ethanolamine utilization protein EutA (predicted chaperonin)
METIQYSLKNKTDYSIDIGQALKYTQTKQNQKNNKNTIQNNLVIEESKRSDDNKNAIFDKACLDIYGNRTCILFEISKDIFQLRFLDNTKNKIVNKQEFYIQIPSLLEKSYTVIVVEKIEDLNMEIVAIHSPPNNTSDVKNIITPSFS